MVRKLTSLMLGYVILVFIIGKVFSVFFDKSTIDPENGFLIKFCIKLVFFMITLLFIRYENIFNWKYIFKNNIFWTTISIMAIGIAFWSTHGIILDNKLKIGLSLEFFYLFSYLGTGFFEEFFFRILIFGLVCKCLGFESFVNTKWSILITSLLFAALHFTNVFNSDRAISGIISQSILAFLLGILFQSIFVRFNNIVLVSVLHSLFDYYGARNSILFKVVQNDKSIYHSNDIWNSLIAFIIIGFLIGVVSYFLTRRRENQIINFKSINKVL